MGIFMSGPRPTPTALKRLHGNPGRRRLNAREPVPAAPKSYDPPDHLTEDQKTIWRNAIANAPVGLLRCLDLAVLELWVTHMALHRRAAAEVFAAAKLVTARKGAAPMPNRHLGIMKNSAAILARLAGELGFSPASRSRVEAAPGAEALPAPAGGKKAKPAMTLQEYLDSAPPRPRFN
jgi:P27 family predicted phage terminase small subunit